MLSHISMNRGNGFTLSHAWYPVTNILTNQKQDQAERVLNSAHQPQLACKTSGRYVYDVDCWHLSYSVA